MFDISQMTSRVQVTVEKISWKMSPKKFIQMGNMQTMIISMGEIIEKLFLKGFRVIKNKCIWRPHLVAKAVLEDQFGIINSLSKIRH